MVADSPYTKALMADGRRQLFGRKPNDPMEKLARRICWLEFGGMSTKLRGTAEPRYWKDLPDETKNRYREEARRFRWLVRAFDKSKDDSWQLIDRTLYPVRGKP